MHTRFLQLISGILIWIKGITYSSRVTISKAISAQTCCVIVSASSYVDIFVGCCAVEIIEMIGSVVGDSVIFFIKKLPVFFVTIILSFFKSPDEKWDDNDESGKSTN